MRVLVIPDIHLKTKKVDEILKNESGGFDHALFLGDYFDDYFDTVKNNRETAEWVRDYSQHSDKTLLKGNHDYSYYASQFHTSNYYCSGYSYEKDLAINRVMGKAWNSLLDFAIIDEVLYTHAGLNNFFLNPSISNEDMLVRYLLDQCRAVNNWLKESKKTRCYPNCAESRLFRAGMNYRGGDQERGGIIWNDAREHEPVPFIKQIFGHTISEEPVIYDNGDICLDTDLKHYAIVTNGVAKIKKVV
jgi:hypothetical protein